MTFTDGFDFGFGLVMGIAYGLFIILLLCFAVRSYFEMAGAFCRWLDRRKAKRAAKEHE